jgi:hypothetical protein
MSIGSPRCTAGRASTASSHRSRLEKSESPDRSASTPGPADARDVGYRIANGQILAIGEAPVHHGEEPVHLVGMAVDRARDLFTGIDAEVIGLAGHRSETAHLPEHSHSLTAAFSRGVSRPNRPVLFARFCRIAPDSNTEIGKLSSPLGSTIAGMRLFGEIARKAGSNCWPTPMSTPSTDYGRPHSSSMMENFHPFGGGQ